MTKIVEFGILCIVIPCLAPKFIFYFYFMFFKMGMGGHLGFRGQDVSKSKNIHFIGFVTPKIVEFSRLYLHISASLCVQCMSCLVLKLSYFMFSKWRWATNSNLEVKMFQNLKKTFH